MNATAQRSPALQTFIDRLEGFIGAKTDDGSPAGKAAARIFAALKTPRCAAEPAAPRTLPLVDRLGEAVAAIPAGEVESRDLAEALEAVSPGLSWTTRPNAEKVGPAFVTGHANAMLVGPAGIEMRKDVWVGVSLMAPGITYPDHNHAPEEVYAVLSAGQWRNGGRDWWEPGIGGIVYNEPNITHAMRSGDRCLLAAWCLWAGGEA